MCLNSNKSLGNNLTCIKTKQLNNVVKGLDISF